MTTFDPQAQAKRIRSSLQSDLIGCRLRTTPDVVALVGEAEGKLQALDKLQAPQEMIALLLELAEYAELLAEDLQTRSAKSLLLEVERQISILRTWVPVQNDRHYRRPSLCRGTAATEWYDEL